MRSSIRPFTDEEEALIREKEAQIDVQLDDPANGGVAGVGVEGMPGDLRQALVDMYLGHGLAATYQFPMVTVRQHRPRLAKSRA